MDGTSVPGAERTVLSLSTPSACSLALEAPEPIRTSDQNANEKLPEWGFFFFFKSVKLMKRAPHDSGTIVPLYSALFFQTSTLNACCHSEARRSKWLSY